MTHQHAAMLVMGEYVYEVGEVEEGSGHVIEIQISRNEDSGLEATVLYTKSELGTGEVLTLRFTTNCEYTIFWRLK